MQLRVSNDEANRQFCLSWLKATYETVSYKVSIEQQVMYKQYLASLHKLGKKDVISAQHYAVCVRWEYSLIVFFILRILLQLDFVSPPTPLFGYGGGGLLYQNTLKLGKYTSEYEVG